MHSREEDSDSESNSSDSSFSWDEAYNFELINTATLTKQNIEKKKKLRSKNKTNDVEKKDEIVNQTANQLAPNAIIYFIKLCRTISSCNASQLQQFMTEMINIFDKSNRNNILKTILLNGLRANYKTIPLILYQQITQIDNIYPKIKYDDSFPNDEEENEPQTENKEDVENKEIKKTLLLIPKDVLCYNLNFLEIEDIFSVSKVCRYLSVVSYDANSIYHIQFPGFIDFIDCSTDSYSKIKSLKLNSDFPGATWSKKNFAKHCHVWNKKLECLKIYGKEYNEWGWNPGKNNKFCNVFDSIKRYFPSVLNLKRFSINLNGNVLDTKFMKTHINQTLLQYLSLENMQISFKEIQCLMQLTNLKMLSLKHVTNVREKNEDFGSLLLRNKKYIGASYPFSLLKEFAIDSSVILPQFINVIHWILMNGIREKMLVLDINGAISDSTQNKELYSRFMISLNIVNALQLNLSQQASIYPFACNTQLNNLNYFKVHTTSAIVPAIQKVIDNIIKYGKSSMVSELICDVKNNFEWFEKWIFSHCKQESKFFGTIHFNLENKIKMFDKEYNRERDRKQLSENGKQIIAKHVLKEFQIIEWFLNRSDNKQKLRQIGVRHLSVNINHKHKHKVENQHEWDWDDGLNEYNYIYEDWVAEEVKQLEKGLDENATDISRKCVNKYVDTKLKKLSQKKKFEYEENENNFSFNYEIDMLASSSSDEESDTNDESESVSDD